MLCQCSPGQAELLQLLVWSSWFLFALNNAANPILAGVGGVYEFTRLASANLRERDDSLNTAIGGFLAGTILGLRGKLFLEYRLITDTRLIGSQLARLPLS
jgi:hypothetical protein